MRNLLTGMIVIGFLAGGAFFFRFWKETKDRLFFLFGIAFTVLGGQQLLLGLLDATSESYGLLFLVRLIAFVIILAAIIEKNLQPTRRR